MNPFFNAQFSYCRLTWVFHSRLLNHEIDRMHEKCLRIVCNDNTSSYERLLETDNSVSVDNRNMWILATELHKIVNGLSSDIMKDVFPLNNTLSNNTRSKRTFHSKNQLHMALKHRLAQKTWEFISTHMKSL